MTDKVTINSQDGSHFAVVTPKRSDMVWIDIYRVTDQGKRRMQGFEVFDTPFHVVLNSVADTIRQLRAETVWPTQLKLTKKWDPALQRVILDLKR